MREDLAPQYDPSRLDAALYARWKAAGVFTAHADRSTRLGGDRVPFVIVIPPPNVTAVLHMGHGLNDTVQDVIVRWRRMAGDEALWVPGTDHAGIATQNVIERQLAQEGLTRFDVGRDAFVERTTRFVAETGGVILKQLEAIGASCDWTRTAYTFSPELSRAVREAFVRLHEAGLIYRGHRVIHWCPRCLTSLSDEEAEFADERGELYQIAYPVAGDPRRTLVVATTRPETMLGDVAVAVHPDDDRYRDLVGRHVVLPIVGIEIPVIADPYADPAFGTGVVKITPAHDANDFEVGARHGLPMPVVIDEVGAMREGADAIGRVPEALRGLDRFDARARIVEMLRASGQLVKVEPHQHAVRHCYRCDTVVEPRLSDQWFVRMAPLAKPALEALRAGRLRVLPERWEAVYVNWMENIRDWNISRQLWWGHRIPVWYCDACGGSPVVSRDDVTACPQCGGPVRQDDDVLDTWFSSWLWPLSTLGWPNEEARARSAGVLSDRRARHRSGDSVLLGGADGDGRPLLHGARAVPHRVPARHRARHAAREDVEVVGQWHRPARRGPRVRRRRAALHGDRGSRVRHRRDARPDQPRGIVRAGAELRHQAVEHRPVHPAEPGRCTRAGAGRHRPGAPHARRRVDPRAPGRRHR